MLPPVSAYSSQSFLTEVPLGHRPSLPGLRFWPIPTLFDCFPLSTLHVQTCDCPRMTRGRDVAATPFTWGSFIPCFMPVYPGAFEPTLLAFFFQTNLTISFSVFLSIFGIMPSLSGYPTTMIINGFSLEGRDKI